MDAARYFIERGFDLHFNDGYDMTYSKFVHKTMILVFARKYCFEVFVIGFTNVGRWEVISASDNFDMAARDAIRRYNKWIFDHHLKRCVLLDEYTIEPIKTSEDLPIAADD